MRPARARFAGTFAFGFVAAIVVELVLAYMVVRSGGFPANADANPSKIEAWIARTSLRAAIRREAPTGPNPISASDSNLSAGLRSYVANCAVCHGTANGKATNVAHGLYQHPPQLASDGVEDDPAGVTFWKVYHGIRFTGMPSFGASLTRLQIWQITAFLQRMDHLPPAVESEWKRARIGEAVAPASLQMEGAGRR